MKKNSFLTRLVVAGCVLLGLIIACGGLTIVTFERLVSAQDHVVREKQQAINLVVDIIEALDAEDEVVLATLANQSDTSAAQVQKARDRFDQLYHQLQSQVKDTADENAYIDLRINSKRYRTAIDQLLLTPNHAGLVRYAGEAHPLLRRVAVDVRHFGESNITSMRQASVDIERDARQAGYILGILTLLALALVVLLVVGSTKSVVRPIAELDRAARTELELRKTRERLEVAVGSSHQIVWDYDMPDGRMESSDATLINAWEFLGHDPADAPADTSGILKKGVHPDDLERVYAAIARFLNSSDREYELESRLLAKDGSIIWTLSRGAALRDANGKAIRFIGTSVDITDLKQAEEALRKSEQRFRVFADHATDAFFLLDEDLVVCDVNRQACKSLGYAREELLGMTPQDFNSDVTPDQLARIQQQLNDGRLVSFESSHRHKDGTIFPVEVRSQSFYEGERRFTVALARDISDRMEAETALRESEERFRSTFENAGVGIALCDAEGNFLRVNQSFSNIVGYSNEEISGKSYQSITHPDDMFVDVNQIQQILRRELPSYSIEKRYIRKDGSNVWVALSASVLLFGVDETPLSLIAIVEDISDRKRLEEDLRASESRFRGIFENAAVGIAQCSLDGKYLQMNQKYGDILRYSSGELLGATFGDVTYPDDLPDTFKNFNSLIRAEIASYTHDKRLVCKDGSLVWTTVTVSVQHDQAGTPFRTIGIIQDISERKRLEEALRESEQRFRFMANSMPHLVWTAGTDGSAEYLNDRFKEYTGLWGEKLVTETFYALIHPSDLDAASKSWSEAVAKGKELDVEYRLRGVDGTYRWFKGHGLPVYDTEGHVIKWVGTVTDIDKQKRAELALERAKEDAEAANRAKDEFLANVSHEIRTPMNAILGMTELVLDTPLTDDQRQSLKTVQSAADSLLAIINDLLDFSRIEAGKMELTDDAFSLRAQLRDTLRALAVRAHRKNVELVSHVHSDVPDSLVGDAGRLRQVILNLVGNAIKFTDEGEVVVRVMLSDEPLSIDHAVLTFSVSDTGIGIPKEKQAKVFRAFEQEDSSTTRKYGGTGLGLTIASQIVELMGGQISVESEVDRGSVFTFTARFRVNPNNDGTLQHLPPVLLKGLRVLVVDDNATNRHILTEYLRSWQMEPVAVGDGIAALGALWEGVTSNQPYDLVMLDARMPDTDGLAIAELIRKRSDLSSTRLILLTSGNRPGDASRFRELKIDAHLLKPVQPEELLDTIYRVMRGTNDISQESTPSGEIGDAVIPIDSRHLRILVAEDNEFNAQVLEMYLTRMGHNVRLAPNGVEALRLADQGNFDLLLLDIHMPGLDGFQVVGKIRAHETVRGGHLPIIALTARSRREDREQCLAAGMDDFLTKPFRAVDLQAALGRIAGLYPMIEASGRHPEESKFTVLDPGVLLSACGGDETMLGKIIVSCRLHLPQQLAMVRDHVRNRDSLQLRESAHKLAGIVVAFSTLAASAASDLEELAAADQTENYLPTTARVEAHCEQLLREIDGLTIADLVRSDEKF